MRPPDQTVELPADAVLVTANRRDELEVRALKALVVLEAGLHVLAEPHRLAVELLEIAEERRQLARLARIDPLQVVARELPLALARVDDALPRRPRALEHLRFDGAAS